MEELGFITEDQCLPPKRSGDLQGPEVDLLKLPIFPFLLNNILKKIWNHCLIQKDATTTLDWNLEAKEKVVADAK